MGRPVVVFDLDGVLFKGDTFTQFALGRFLRPSRAGRAAWSWAWRDRRPGAPHGLAVLAGASVQGMSQVEYDQAAATLGARLARSSRVMHDGVARARQHQKAGCQVVVATACERGLAEAYLRGVDLDVVVIGSRLEPPSNLVRHNRGQAKVTALAQAGFTGPFLAAYSDSLSDAPMLREAATPVLVNPSAACWRRALEVLGERVRRVNWR